MRKLTLLLILSAALACGGEKVDPICAADCIGKIRPKAQQCGEDQACKQAALDELKSCEASCNR